MSTNANKKKINEMCLLSIAVGNLLCQNLFRVTQGINVKYKNKIPIMFQEVGRSICNVLSFIIFSVFFCFISIIQQNKRKRKIMLNANKLLLYKKNHSTVSASLLLSMRD
jgi:hypothetical protein